MRRIPLTLLFALVACGAVIDAPEASHAAAAQPLGADRMVVGAEHRYHFDWRVDSDAAHGPTGDVPLHGGLHVRGELALRVHAVDADGALVGLEILRVDEASVELLGQDVLPDGDVLAHHEILLRVAPDGDVGRAWIAHDVPAITRHVLTGLAGQTDLRVGEGEREAPGSNGLARVRYARNADEPALLERSLDGYTRIDAAVGIADDAPWSFDGSARITHDERGMTTAIEAVEVVALAGEEEEGLAFESRTRFTLARTEELVFEVVTPEPSALRELDLLAPPDLAEAERELARRFAEGLTVADLQLTLYAGSTGQRPPKGFMVRAKGLLRGWPEHTDAVVPLYHAAEDERGRALVLDVLSSAQTDVAQRVMAELLLASRAREPHELPRLVRHVSFVEQPIPELATTMLELHEEAVARGDEPLRRASAYPLGALAGRISRREPALAERMMAPLRGLLASARTSEDRAAGIAALGNAALPADLPRIRLWAVDPDDHVRADAIVALRHHHGAASDDLLFAALRDPSRTVASAALTTIRNYRRRPEHLSRLAIAATAGWYHPELVGEIASVLAARDPVDGLVRGALASLSPRADDVHTRMRIQRALASAAG